MLILSMITSVISLNGAGKSLTYQIDLDVTDFRIERDDEDRLSISSDCHTLGFGDDTTQPALPFKGIAVALPADTRFVSCSYIPTKCDSFPYSPLPIRNTGRIISYENDGEKLIVTTSVSDDYTNVELMSLTPTGH